MQREPENASDRYVVAVKNICLERYRGCNYFRPSNGLSEPTGSISVALKSREQGTSSPPCARSAEYFLRPVTVHFIVPLCRKLENI